MKETDKKKDLYYKNLYYKIYIIRMQIRGVNKCRKTKQNWGTEEGVVILTRRQSNVSQN